MQFKKILLAAALGTRLTTSQGPCQLSLLDKQRTEAQEPRTPVKVTWPASSRGRTPAGSSHPDLGSFHSPPLAVSTLALSLLPCLSYTAPLISTISLKSPDAPQIPFGSANPRWLTSFPKTVVRTNLPSLDVDLILRCIPSLVAAKLGRLRRLMPVICCCGTNHPKT